MEETETWFVHYRAENGPKSIALCTSESGMSVRPPPFYLVGQNWVFHDGVCPPFWEFPPYHQASEFSKCLDYIC